MNLQPHEQEALDLALAQLKQNAALQRESGEEPRARRHTQAFALDCHPVDFMHEIAGSLKAITALAGGAKFAELSDAEQAGYLGLTDRLADLQVELAGMALE